MNTPGSVTSGGVPAVSDPYDWSVEEVIADLWSPGGGFRLRYPSVVLPPTFVGALRVQGVDGEAWLGLTDKTLKKELELDTIGLRCKVLQHIKALGYRSPKYAKAVEAEATKSRMTELQVTANLMDQEHPGLVGHSTQEQHRHMETVAVDAHGRKRRRLDLETPTPMTPKEALESDGGLEDVPPEEYLRDRASKRSLAEDQPEAETEQRTRKARDQYLGDEPLLVESLFYGASKLGEEITIEKPQGFIQTGVDADHDWFFSTRGQIPRGHRKYVSQRMKHSMLQEEGTFTRQGRTYAGKVHYPPSKHCLEYHDLTLFVPNASGNVSRRVDASAWAPSENDLTITVGLEPLPETRTAGLFPEHEPSSESKKDDPVLEVYGESGSENIYDSDNWEEMQAETAEAALNHPDGTKRPLTTAQVYEILNDNHRIMAAEWRLRCLPKLHRKARRVWIQVREMGTKHSRMAELYEQISGLQNRYEKLVQEVTKDLWASEGALRKQCPALQPTIELLESCKWELDIIRSRHAPEKAAALQPRNRPAQQPIPARQDDEESLTTDHEATSESAPSEDDFIDDSGSLPGLPGLDDSNYHYDAEDQDDLAQVNVDRSARRSVQEAMEMDVPAAAKMHDSEDKATEEGMANAGADESNASPHGSLTRTSSAPSEGGSLVLDQEQGSSVPSPQVPVDNPSLASGLSNDIEAATRSSLPPSPEKRSAPALPLADVIDLTSLPDHPLPPASTTDEVRIKTPPVDDENDQPLRSSLFEPAVWREPPVPERPQSREVVDLVTTDDPSLSESESQQSSNDPLPDVDDIVKFAAMTRGECGLFEERSDGKRLLTWFLVHSTPEERHDMQDTIGAASSISFARTRVWKGLEAMKTHAHKIRELDERASSAYMRIATCYIIWTQCNLPHETRGWKLEHVSLTIKATSGFENFWTELASRIASIGKATKELSKASPGKKTTRKRIDYDESPSASQGSLKKRTYVPVESELGKTLRSEGLKRKAEREERRRQLQREIARTGASVSAMAIVNAGKGPDEPDIRIHDTIAQRIKSHQIEGVQFIWGEIVADHDTMQGCLLAHTMGLGKTMQVITFLATLAEASNSADESILRQIPEGLRTSRSLILCPTSLVENWFDEFLIWMPPDSPLGDVRKVVSAITLQHRLYEIDEWHSHGGVLLISYDIFKDLVSDDTGKRRGRPSNPVAATRAPGPEDDDSEEPPSRRLNDDQRRLVRHHLLDGPNVVIADEAHAIKNPNTKISAAVHGFRTTSRIALTGSPLANNLGEYYEVINWIAPGYLGEISEYRYKYMEPIQAGLYQDAFPSDKRKMLKMLTVLKQEVAPKVHRADLSVLKGMLGKTEFVIRVPLTAIQEECYRLYVEGILESTKGEPSHARLWAWLAVLRLLCNHPSLFKAKVTGRADERKATVKKKAKRDSVADAVTEEADALLESFDTLQLNTEMIRKQLEILEPVDDLEDIAYSHKMSVLMDILDFAEEAEEKTLIFSHSIPTLDYIESHLRLSARKLVRLDGSTKVSARQQLSKDFNETNRHNICLISTRAGGQGLNFYGASRVVIIDDSFNPMYEEQAIGRAYRIGQQKHVYVYRLTVGGTFEEALHNQSLFKVQLATRVVDKKQPMRRALKGLRDYLFLPRAVKTRDLNAFVITDPLILARVLAGRNGQKPSICSIDLTETLHEEADEKLTAEELKEAQQMIQDEQLRRKDPMAWERKRTFANGDRRYAAPASIAPSVGFLPYTNYQARAKYGSTQAAWSSPGNGVASLASTYAIPSASAPTPALSSTTTTSAVPRLTNIQLPSVLGNGERVPASRPKPREPDVDRSGATSGKPPGKLPGELDVEKASEANDTEPRRHPGSDSHRRTSVTSFPRADQMDGTMDVDFSEHASWEMARGDSPSPLPWNSSDHRRENSKCAQQ